MHKKARFDIDELKKNSMSRMEYLEFRKAVISTHIEIKKDIKEYIERNPEAESIGTAIK